MSLMQNHVVGISETKPRQDKETILIKFENMSHIRVYFLINVI